MERKREKRFVACAPNSEVGSKMELTKTGNQLSVIGLLKPNTKDGLTPFTVEYRQRY